MGNVQSFNDWSKKSGTSGNSSSNSASSNQSTGKVESFSSWSKKQPNFSEYKKQYDSVVNRTDAVKNNTSESKKTTQSTPINKKKTLTAEEQKINDLYSGYATDDLSSANILGYDSNEARAGNRIGNIVSGAAKDWASGMVSFGSTATSVGNAAYDASTKEQQNVSDSLYAGYATDDLSTAQIGSSNQFSDNSHNENVANAKRWEQTAKNLSTSAQTDLANAKEGLGKVGQAGVDIASNMIEMGFDAVTGIATGSALVPMFIRSAGSASMEARDAGASLGQQVGYGLARGAVEVATEKMFDGLAGLYGTGVASELSESIVRKLAKTDTGRTVVRAIVNAAGEGAEEVVSDLVQPMAQAIYQGSSALNQYVPGSEGFTDYMSEMGYDFLIGAACSALGGSVSLVNGQNARANTELRNVDENMMSDEDRTTIQSAVKSRLEQLGEKENTESVSKAIVDYMNGRDNRSNKKTIEGSTYGQRVLNELTEDDTSNDWVQKIGTKKYGGAAYGAESVRDQVTNAAKRVGMSEEEAKTATPNDIRNRIAVGAKQRTIEQRDLKSLSYKAQDGTDTSGEITGFNTKKGKTVSVRVRNDDGTETSVPIESANLTETQAITMERLSSTLREDSGVAMNMINAGQNVYDYSVSFGNIRDLFGRTGATEGSALHSPLRGNLTDEQVRAAYTLGRAKRNTTRAKSKIGKGHVSYNGGTVNGQKLNPVKNQKEVMNREDVKVVRYLAEALHIDVVLFESEADEEGNFHGSNGAYQNGVIYLDVNANMSNKNDIGNRALLLTMSHELTHFIQQNSLEKYEELKSFISEKLSESNLSFNELVEEKLRREPGITSRDAIDEVMADACETMLTNSKYVREMAETRPDLFESVKKFISDFLEKIRTSLARHAEAKEMLNYADELQKLWDDALTDAVNSREGYVEMKNKSGETVGVNDGKGHAQSSIRTYDEGGREQLKSFLDKRVESGAITRSEANDTLKQMNMMYDICKEFAHQYTLFGEWSNAKVVTDPETGNAVFSVVKANGEYALNLDFSLVCKKRRTLDALFNKMISDGIMDDFKMVESSIAAINDIIRENDFETACALCFVDSKRYRQGLVADSFVNIYNPLVRSLAKKGQTIDYFNFGGSQITDNINASHKNGSIETLDDSELDFSTIDKVLKTEKKGTVKWKAAMDLKEHPEDRKLVQRGDFMSTAGFDKIKATNGRVLSLYNSKKGAGGPKAAQSDVQYLSEILQQSRFNEESAYSVGGVRIQSFSDYIPRLVFDYVQMIGDLSAKKLPAHAYTKEPMFALQFGLTGIKTNMSLVPEVMKDGVAPGLDKNGNYAWRDGQSFGSTVYGGNPEFVKKCLDIIGKEYNGQDRLTAQEGYELAIKIQEAAGYSKNCGTIAVGVSDAHIRKMLDDPNIRMIIPYHKSSLNHIVAVMTNIDKYTDYTKKQNTRYANGSRLKKSDDTFNYNEALQRLGDAKAAADEYLAWCDAHNYLPKFDQFRNHENYYKVLEDFSCYDNGEATPQQGVTLTLPTEESAFGSMKELIRMGLDEDVILQNKQDTKVPEIVEKIKNTLPTIEEEYSTKKKTSKKKAVTKASDAQKNGTVDEKSDNFKVQLSARDALKLDVDWDNDNNSSIKSQLISHQNELINMSPVTSVNFSKGNKSYYEEVDEILRTRFGYKIQRQDISFAFDKQSINVLRHYISSESEAAALISAPYVLKRGKIISGHKNHKGNGYPSLTFAAPVTLNNKRANVAVVVLFADKDRAHSLRVLTPNGKEFSLEIEKETDSEMGEAPNGVHIPTESVLDKNISQNDGENKPQNSLRDPDSVVGVNINDKSQPFTEQILSGIKTIETRESKDPNAEHGSLYKYVGKRIAIVRTGKGKATVVGWATIADEKKYGSKDEFTNDFSKHRISNNSPFKWKEGTAKFGYVLTDVEREEHPYEVTEKGIVVRDVNPEHQGNAQLSQRDSDYTSSLKSGNSYTADKIIRDSALEWGAIVDGNGRPLKLYHGTPSFGFTEYNTEAVTRSKGMIYGTTKREVAANYAGRDHYASVRNIGKKLMKGTSANALIHNYEQVFGAKLHEATGDERASRIRELVSVAKTLSDENDTFSGFDDVLDTGALISYQNEYGLTEETELYNALSFVMEPVWTIGAGEFTVNQNGTIEESYMLDEIESSISHYQKWYEPVRSYLISNYDKIKGTRAEDYYKFLTSYKFTDANIDFTTIPKAASGKEVFTENGKYFRTQEEIVNAIDNSKNIGAYQFYGKSGENMLTVDGSNRDWLSLKFSQLGDSYYSTDQISKWARDNGYTSVLFKNVQDGGERADEYVFFNSNQVKSADVVTYDDEGNVIPPSQRFNDSENDFRFSQRDESKTDRELLAESLDSITEDEEEHKLLSKYKEQINEYQDLERQIVEERAKLSTLNSAGITAKKNGVEIYHAYQDALKRQRKTVKTLEDKLTEYDKRLLKLESMEPLKNVMKRERARQRERMREQNRERTTKKETKVKINKLINDLNKRLLHSTEKNYVPKELVNQTIDILKAINLDSGRSEKLREKLLELREQYDNLQKDKTYASAAYDTTISDMLKNMIDKVGTTPIQQMNVEQLDAVYQTLKAMSHVIKDAVKVRIDGEERNFFEISTEMIRETRTVKKPADNIYTKWLQAQLTPERMFNRLGNYTKNSTWLKVYRMLNEGQLKSSWLLMDGTRMFDGLIDGANEKNYASLTDYHKGKLIDVGLTDVDGNSIPITRGMMLSLYMHLLNDNNARHIARGGLTVPVLSRYYNRSGDRGWGVGQARAMGKSVEISEARKNLEEAQKMLDDATAVMQRHLKDNESIVEDKKTIEILSDKVEEAEQGVRDAIQLGEDYVNALLKRIASELTDYEKSFVEVAKDMFDGWSKDQLNETTLEVYGIKKAQVPNYFPICTDKDFIDAPFESIVRDFNLENVGFMKERVEGASGPIYLMDITDVTSTQIKRVAQYCGIMPAVRSFNKIIGKTQEGWSDSLKNAVKDKFGQGGIKYIENLMQDLNGARHASDSAGTEFLNKIRGNMAQASLTLSLRTAMGQTASYPTAASVVGWKNLGKALVRGGRNNTIISRADKELIAKYSPLLWYRMQGFSTVELGDLSGNSTPNKLWRKMKWATGWIEAMDGATVGRLWYAAQYYIDEKKPTLAKGSDEYYREVAKVFNDIVEKTQPDYTTMQRPDILRNPDAVIRQLTMFMTQRLQNFNILYDSCATYSKYKADFAAKRNGVTAEDVKEAGQQSVNAVISQIVAAATIVGFKYLADIILHSMKAYRDDDEDLTKESISKELLNQFISSLASNFLFGSELYDIYCAFKGDTYYGVEVTSVSTVVDIVEAVVNLEQAIVTGGKTSKEIVSLAEKLGQKIGVCLGLPVSNAMKIVNGLVNWGEDIKNGEAFSFEAGNDRTNSQQIHRLYKAYASGDKQGAKEILEEIGNDKQAKADLKEYVGKLFIAGDITEAEAKKFIQTYCAVSADDAKEQVLSWKCKIEYGVSASGLKEAYEEGKISAVDVRKALIKYKGLSTDEAVIRVSYWDYTIKHPSSDIYESTYTKWYTNLRSYGVSIDTYYKIYSGANTDGKEGITQAEAAVAIHNAGLTGDAAEAMWLCFNKSWTKTSYATYCKKHNIK